VIFAGEVIAASRDPEHAACRFLLAIGLTGRVRFWSDVYALVGTSRDYRSSLDIERGAKFSISDSDRGLRVVKYSDHWQREDEAPELEQAA
jgi:hypothetical protein